MQPYSYKLIEYRVIDGDSIELVQLDLGFRMRLKAPLRVLGVDCPEKHTEAGKAVTAAVEHWMSGADNLIVRSSRLDKYGRVLGDIQRDETDWLSDFLIDRRFAMPYDGGAKSEWVAEQLAAAEENALRFLVEGTPHD